MKRIFLILLFSSLFCAVSAQELVPKDKAPIYRRSFTARYELTGEKPVREASLSPDSTLVAFVRGNNLFVRDIASGRETQITTDGERNRIINGATDWVYEEEYLFTRAYEFSPDSRYIAYLRFDETLVPEFTMMRYGGRLYPEPYTFKYPKAGEANSIVTLWVYDTSSGEKHRIDTGRETDQYIPRLGWTSSGEPFFYRVNRLQNIFEVVLAGADGGTRVIYSESSPTYVERPTDETITFLPDGDRFIVKQETRTGWMHLYLHSIKKGFLNAITKGEWEVTDLLGVEGDMVRYESTEHSPLDRGEYTVRLDGKKKEAQVKPVFRDIDAREFFTFKNEAGIELNGWMIKPYDFNPAKNPDKKYPVLMTQYSGPGSQSVNYNDIHPGDAMIYSPLVKAGYVVVCVDGRGTGFRGEAFKKCTYGQLGKLETEDQIAAARWLASQSWVDPTRIGIYGWSFGGFVALNAILKGADVFALAVAVAPVTSWRYYDTIYTEIYNNLPANNPEGYDDNSPLNHASLLRGKLLLVHGTGDDNVHVQNSYEMAYELVKAGRQFDMMTYTDDNHSMMPAGPRHVRQKIADYVITNL